MREESFTYFKDVFEFEKYEKGNNKQDVSKSQRFKFLKCCPYCGGDLIYFGLSWAKVSEGQYSILTYEVECMNEPKILEGEMWENWFDQHNIKLDKIQVPLDTKILAFLNRKYNFI